MIFICFLLIVSIFLISAFFAGVPPRRRPEHRQDLCRQSSSDRGGARTSRGFETRDHQRNRGDNRGISCSRRWRELDMARVPAGP